MAWPEPNQWTDAEPSIRRWWEANRGKSTRKWDEVQAYYRFGWEWGRSRTYTGQTWEEAEPSLQRLWDQLKTPEQPTWDQVKGTVVLGWQRSRSDSWGHDWQRETW